jgi:DNA-binding transcriptional ArsR family regulator
MPETITLHGITPKELRKQLREVMQEEFDLMFEELQRAMGEDDLVSTGTARRLLGVSDKTLKALTDMRHFTVYHHLKEKRFNRGELLDYRSKHMVKRKRG